MKMIKHPIQPLAKDEHGTIRFKENKIVSYMLEAGREGKRFDLNSLACMDFPIEDRIQLAQLIGYSLSGFGELGHVDDQSYEAAEKMFNQGKDEKDARIEHLEEVLATVREGLKIATPAVFRIHPDDLSEYGY